METAGSELYYLTATVTATVSSFPRVGSVSPHPTGLHEEGQVTLAHLEVCIAGEES